MPLTWILRRRGRIQTEKVTGIEFMPLVVPRPRGGSAPHLLLRRGPGVAVRAEGCLEQMTPGVHVVGAAAPPFGETRLPDRDQYLGVLGGALRQDEDGRLVSLL
jgi:UDP-N-acetyl-D-mannosaminuronic acid transferase (WecB/TagA/CpsF family)